MPQQQTGTLLATGAFDVSTVQAGETLTVVVGAGSDKYVVKLVRSTVTEAHRPTYIYGWSLANMTLPGVNSVRRTRITRHIHVGGTIAITARSAGAPTFTSGTITAIIHEGTQVR